MYVVQSQCALYSVSVHASFITCCWTEFAAPLLRNLVVFTRSNYSESAVFWYQVLRTTLLHSLVWRFVSSNLFLFKFRCSLCSPTDGLNVSAKRITSTVRAIWQVVHYFGSSEYWRAFCQYLLSIAAECQVFLCTLYNNMRYHVTSLMIRTCYTAALGTVTLSCTCIHHYIVDHVPWDLQSFVGPCDWLITVRVSPPCICHTIVSRWAG